MDGNLLRYWFTFLACCIHLSTIYHNFASKLQHVFQFSQYLHAYQRILLLRTSGVYEESFLKRENNDFHFIYRRNYCITYNYLHWCWISMVNRLSNYSRRDSFILCDVNLKGRRQCSSKSLGVRLIDY